LLSKLEKERHRKIDRQANRQTERQNEIMNKRMNVKINVWKNKCVKEQKKSPCIKIPKKKFFPVSTDLFFPIQGIHI